MFPSNFAIMIEEAVFWKAWLSNPIVIRPGTMKTPYGTELTRGSRSPRDRPKITRYRPAEMTGVTTVCVGTERKRSISLHSRVGKGTEGKPVEEFIAWSRVHPPSALHSR